MHHLSFKRILNSVIIVLIAWYIILCLTHFLTQRPLWNDEQCVFNSIKSFSAQQMFGQKLLNIQVFPRLYLFAIQNLSRLFDFHLLSLRFLPLVFMLAAYILWLKLARYELQDRLSYFTFVLSWPASAMLLYYAAELKPYSMDVLTGSIFLLFLYNQERLYSQWTEKKFLSMILVLPALGLVSYPAFLWAFLPLHNLIRKSRKCPKVWRQVAFYSFSLILFVSVSYIFDMRFRHVIDVTDGFGDYFISFASVGEFFKTFGEGTMNLFVKWLVIRPRYIKAMASFFMFFGLIYMIVAFAVNLRKEKYYFRTLNTIAFVVFVELFVMGALKKYPFTVPRTSLFFCPIVLLLTVKGIEQIKRMNKYLYWVMEGSYVIFLMVLMVALSRIVLIGKLDFQPVIF